MKKLFMTTAAALFAMATVASAASLSIVGGVAGTIPDGKTNDVLKELGLGPSVGGFYQSSIVASGFGLNGKIKVEVMGWEASFKNSFITEPGTASEQSFKTPGIVEKKKVAADLNSPLATWIMGNVVDGLLDFLFDTPNGDIVNGDPNLDNTGNPNFFATREIDGKLWLFLDDGGAGPDDNHDDLVVRLSAVPLPGGVLLLLTGVGAMALRRRRKAA